MASEDGGSSDNLFLQDSAGREWFEDRDQLCLEISTQIPEHGRRGVELRERTTDEIRDGNGAAPGRRNGSDFGERRLRKPLLAIETIQFILLIFRVGMAQIVVGLLPRARG